MIKAIAAITSLASIAIASAPAQALQTHRGGHINGYHTPYIYEGDTRRDLDVIHIEGPRGREIISVTCAPFNWHAHGPNSSDFADSIARSWCF